MKRVLMAATIVAMAGTVGWAQTQSAPPIMDYQGKLTAIDGTPLSDGSYTVEFNIYPGKTGGAPVWGPQIFDNGTSVGHAARARLIDGHFTIFLSEDTDGDPITVAFQGATRYVGIKIDGGPELQPRQQVLGSPYALQAERLDGRDISDILTKDVYDSNDDGRVDAADHATYATHGVPVGSIMPYFGNQNTPPVGWLYCNGSAIPDQSQYQALRNHIKTQPYISSEVYNPGAPTVVKTPDLRSQFLRGMNRIGTTSGRTTSGRTDADGNRYFGAWQRDEYLSHNHNNGPWRYLLQITGTYTVKDWDSSATEPNIMHEGWMSSGSGDRGAETVPMNVTVNFIIKY